MIGSKISGLVEYGLRRLAVRLSMTWDRLANAVVRQLVALRTGTNALQMQCVVCS